jgi:hypothetical protein
MFKNFYKGIVLIYLGGGDQFGLAGLKSREEYEERIIELHCVIAELTR